MKTKPLSKHQKLILQCYPAGRGVDKRPNASELSYLLYYVSTRRAKLSKVGAFLERNARTDVYRARSGNVEVTLDIVKALIERCYEDLNLFAWHVVGILGTVLTSDDLALCQKTCEVFTVFCKRHDGALFTGDPDYVKSFHELVNRYIEISANAKGPNELQWRFLGIHAAKSVAGSAAVSVPTGHVLSSKLGPLVLSVLTHDDAELLNLRNKVDEQVTTEATTSAATDDNDHKEEDVRKKMQLTAMEALKHFFDATASVQLRHSTKVVVKYILDNGYSSRWSTTLIQIVAKWTPVQIRFVVLLSLVDVFVNQQVGVVQTQLELTGLISSLLSSSVNMVGLSVMDVLRVLVNHQHKMIRHQIDIKDVKEPLDPLIESITNCIASITTHIYYADQISDMVSDILTRTHHGISVTVGSSGPTSSRSSSSLNHMLSEQNSNVSSANNHQNHPHKYSAKARTKVLMTDLKNVEAILKVSKSNQGLDTNKISINAWEGTQSLITHDNREVRLAFASAFITYLKHGVTDYDKHLKLHSQFMVVRGTLGRIIWQIYVAAVDVNVRRNDLIVLNHLLSNLIDYLGINAIVRVIPVALMMQDVGISVEHGKNTKGYHLEQGIGQACLALATLSNVSTRLEMDRLQDTVSKSIRGRKSNGLWYKALDSPILIPLEEDLETKQELTFEPVEPSHAAQTVPLEKETIEKDLRIKDFPEDLKHILFQEIEAEDSSPGNNTDSYTDPGTENILVVKARSLKQLRYNSYSRPSTVHSHDNGNKEDRPTYNGRSPSSELLSRDVNGNSLPKPRVADLKRVASGVLNGNASFTSRRGRSDSVMSNSTYGEPAQENGNTNDNHESLDITSFLNNLDIKSSNERGRLVN
ncbi:hypothetical protein TRICI_001344 [Trichomonascus ciferrii]|uniref:Protein EFR3 n=1 Tax=Trichomonascus ciferrii TaxID=44093 RepID=A0A642V9I6_9ASCO|nr:hypothetical protein TRICI_001344 [Trichomonascus ciferrii]